MSLNLDNRTEDFPSIFRLIFFNVILNKVTPIPSNYTQQHLASTWLHLLEKRALLYRMYLYDFREKQ